MGMEWANELYRKWKKRS